MNDYNNRLHKAVVFSLIGGLAFWLVVAMLTKGTIYQ